MTIKITNSLQMCFSARDSSWGVYFNKEKEREREREREREKERSGRSDGQRHWSQLRTYECVMWNILSYEMKIK